MRISHLLLALLLATGWAAASEERYADELNCLPTNGYIQLPGIAYDDLTPEAREIFDANPAAVTNALYSLPLEQREVFIDLYLEPVSRERHRYFFFRCQENAARRAAAASIEGCEVIPGRLLAELQDRQPVQYAQSNGAIPFRAGSTTVYVPAPTGYEVEPASAGRYPHEDGMGQPLAVFRKTQSGGDQPSRPGILAVVRQVREGSENIHRLLERYRGMVDLDWRLTALYPPEASVENAERAEYRWNVQPFSLRDTSFCYGQFEKVMDFHGVDSVRYRAAAIVTGPGTYIQIGIMDLAGADLDTVNAMNRDLTAWRDAIITANQP